MELRKSYPKTLLRLVSYVLSSAEEAADEDYVEDSEWLFKIAMEMNEKATLHLQKQHIPQCN